MPQQIELVLVEASLQTEKQTVVALAAARFREHGLDGIGIADLMKSVGMSHGGFYKQFQSKDDLVRQGA